MTGYLTKEDLRSILREELPPIVTSIVTDAIKANNEILVPMIMSMVKEEIISIYDEFGKIEIRFEGIDKKFENIDAHFENIDARFESIDAHFESIDARFKNIDSDFECIDKRFESMDKKFESAHAELVEFKKDMNDQMSRIHSTVNMAVGYKSVIQDIDTRLYAMEQKAIYEKNKDEI